MKRKTLIVNLLILILGFQAVWASADEHQWHDGESDHQAVVEHEIHDAQLQDLGEELESHDHHCCHCMSCHLTFLTPSHIFSDVVSNTSISHKGEHQPLTPWLTMIFRPPIS